MNVPTGSCIPSVVFVLILVGLQGEGTYSVAAAEFILSATPSVRIEGSHQSSVCDLSMTGDIAANDLAKFDFALRETRKARSPATPLLLCMDSKGGNYDEGLRIAERVLRDGNIATQISSGSSCYSACGLVFLSGGAKDSAGRPYPARWLHVRGELGFHAPFVPAAALPDRKFTLQELHGAVQAGSISMQRLLATFNKTTRALDGGEPVAWVRESLFAEMLSRGPNELFAIDTIDKVGRWRIELRGARLPALTARSSFEACRNLIAWNFDYYTHTYERLPSSWHEPPSQTIVAGNERFEFRNRSHEGWVCTIESRKTADEQMAGVVMNYHVAISGIGSAPPGGPPGVKAERLGAWISLDGRLRLKEVMTNQ